MAQTVAPAAQAAQVCARRSQATGSLSVARRAAAEELGKPTMDEQSRCRGNRGVRQASAVAETGRCRRPRMDAGPGRSA